MRCLQFTWPKNMREPRHEEIAAEELPKDQPETYDAAPNPAALPQQLRRLADQGWIVYLQVTDDGKVRKWREVYK